MLGSVSKKANEEIQEQAQCRPVRQNQALPVCYFVLIANFLSAKKRKKNAKNNHDTKRLEMFEHSLKIAPGELMFALFLFRLNRR